MSRGALFALGAAGLALAIGPGGLDGAERAAAATEAQNPPTRLWYRVRADVTLNRRGRFTFADGLGDTRTTTGSLRLRSRTAVIVFRQCTPTAPTSKSSAKVAARRLNLATSHTCAQMRRAARRAGVPPRIIRAARLVDDIRVTAGGEGNVFDYDKRVVNDGFEAPRPPTGTEVCPPRTTLLGRLTGADPIKGKLQTGSAARKGVAVTITTRLRSLKPMMTGLETGPCFIRETGQQTTGSSQFRTQPFSLRRVQAFEGPEVPDPVRFRTRGRFGSSLRATGRTNRTLNFANGSEQVTITTKLVFQRCPRRGGRTNAGC